jgi:hypothetical protein
MLEVVRIFGELQIEHLAYFQGEYSAYSVVQEEVAAGMILFV